MEGETKKAFDVPCKFQLYLSFGFPNTIPACWRSISIFLFSSLSLLPSPLHIFFYSFTSSMFSHVCLPTHLLNSLTAGTDCSCAWRKRSLMSWQLSWAPLSFKAASHRISPHLFRITQSQFSWRVCSLPFALLTPLRILNAAISWLLQPTLPLIITSPNSPSLVMSTRSRRASSWTRWPVQQAC